MKVRLGRLAAGLGLSLIAAGAGVVVAVTTPWSSPAEEVFDTANEPAVADLDYGANSRLEPASADPDVEFPSVLSELPNPPTHLAVNPDGDLWFLMFTYDGTANDLYRFSAEKGTLESQAIPASTGSELYSDIAVDSRGHVISAEGNVVLDIDPGGGYKALPLPAPVNVTIQSGREGTYVIDMALSRDDKAYLTRMNTAAITELNIRTGETREIPVPVELGQFYYIALAGDDIWMTTWADTEQVPTQTAVLSLANGEVQGVSTKSVAFGADQHGRVYASTQGGSGLMWADSKGATQVSVPGSARSLSGLLDFIVVDDERGRVWTAGGEGITSRDVSSGKTDHYILPIIDNAVPIHIPSSCLGVKCDFTPKTEITHVGGIAVAPNGDVYFSDKGYNRIGVIHPR